MEHAPRNSGGHQHPSSPYEYSTLPEAVPEELQPGGFIQRVPLENEAESTESKIVYNDAGLIKVDDETKHQDSSSATPPVRPWWRRRLTSIIIAGIAVVVVGLVVGLTVGLLTRKRRDEPTPVDTTFGTPISFPSNGTSRPSACRGIVCPSMLAAAQVSTTDDLGFFVFSRGSDRAIWYRRGSQNAWDDDWASLGGEFESQPYAVVVGDDQIYVFAAWSDGSVRSKSFRGGEWTRDWESLQGNTTINAPSVCSWGPNNIEVFATDEENLLIHRRFNGAKWDPALDDPWQKWGGYTSAAPAAVCPSSGRVDVVSYGGYADALHDVGWMHYKDGKWDLWEGNSRPNADVGYLGDPTLVVVDGETIAVLGVGSDKQMYYTEWSPTANYSVTEGLGGSFESMASVLTSPNGNLDVLAVGKEDRLMHKARVDGTWATDWEDLGGYFNSAPLPMRLGDGRIVVFGLGPNGNMIHGKWTLKDNFTWGEGEWFNDSGNLAIGWLRAGPA